jgi:hypothetical protein
MSHPLISRMPPAMAAGYPVGLLLRRPWLTAR